MYFLGEKAVQVSLYKPYKLVKWTFLLALPYSIAVNALL